MSKEKTIDIIIVGDETDVYGEHYTYIRNEKGEYYKYCYHVCEGVPFEKVLALIKFLGYKPFIIHKSEFNPSEVANDKYFEFYLDDDYAD